MYRVHATWTEQSWPNGQLTKYINRWQENNYIYQFHSYEQLLPFYLAPKMLFSLLCATILLHALTAVLKMDSELKVQGYHLPHEITRNFVIIVAAYKFNINRKVNQKLLLVK